MSSTSEQSTMSAAIDPTAKKPSAIKVAVQVCGFVLGLGMLWWCVSMVLQPKNQEQLQKLLAAPLEMKAGLVGLSLMTMLISGATFRQSLMPVRRLKMLDVQAVNVIASLLAIAPMKLSVVFRVLMHNRRDGVPLLTIGAWFASVAAVMACVVVPVMGMSYLIGKPDLVWAVGSIVGVGACIGLLLVVARWMASDRNWSKVQRWWGLSPLPMGLKNSALIDRIHEGVRMLASPSAVLICVGLRFLDIGVQAARFKLAAEIVGQPLSWDVAVLVGAVYFLIGALAPTGQAGAREGGTAKILQLILRGADMASFAVIPLLISAVELCVQLVGSVLALIWLRSDRLLKNTKA